MLTTLGKNILGIGVALVVVGIAVPLFHSPKPKLSPIDYSVKGKPLYSAMIRISTKNGICTATVISRNYAITAGHCVVGQIGDKYNVGSVSGNTYKPKTVKAIAVRGFMYGGIDAGLLKGDFSDFSYAPIENGDLNYTHPLVSCGHAAGSPTPMCRPLIPAQPYGFIAVGMGNLIPGMSGGPVIDVITGRVVGINSAQDGNAAFFTPTTKLLAFFGLESLDDID